MSMLDDPAVYMAMPPVDRTNVSAALPSFQHRQSHPDHRGVRFRRGQSRQRRCRMDLLCRVDILVLSADLRELETKMVREIHAII